MLHGWKSSDRISRHRNLIPNVVSRVSKGIFSVMYQFSHVFRIFSCINSEGSINKRTKLIGKHLIKAKNIEESKSLNG